MKGEIRMEEELKRLGIIRQDLNAKKEMFTVAEQRFRTENEDLIKSIGDLAEKQTEAETNIREQALSEYEKTGEKKFGCGVGIRIMKSLIYEEKQALTWAKTHSLALKLDRRAFENIAKAEDIDFVKTQENATATIPTKIQVE